MRIGSFLGISFRVTESTYRTLESLSWSASGKWATHQRHMKKDLPERTGSDLQSASFDMFLSAYLGVDPLKLFKRMVRMSEQGRAGSLIVGRKRIGSSRWVIKSCKMDASQYDGHGGILSAKVAVTLQEYPS